MNPSVASTSSIATDKLDQSAVEESMYRNDSWPESTRPRRRISTNSHSQQRASVRQSRPSWCSLIAGVLVKRGGANSDVDYGGTTPTPTCRATTRSGRQGLLILVVVVGLLAIPVVLFVYRTTTSVMMMQHYALWPDGIHHFRHQHPLEMQMLKGSKDDEDSMMNIETFYELQMLQSPEAEDSFIIHNFSALSRSGDDGINQEGTPPLVVFYNVYIHPNDTNPTSIVDEQIAYIGNSYAAKFQNHNLTIYYNHIGSEKVVTSTYMEQLCRKNNDMKCIQLQHYDNADESVTLGAARGFCLQYPNSRIIYLHNKGSYQPSKVQKPWRQGMIRAITSQLCLDNLGSEGKGRDSGSSFPGSASENIFWGNVCGMIYWPMWMPLYPGNFFTAHCSYVRKLVPPQSYASRHDSMICDRPRDLQTSLYVDWQIEAHGRGRYALETWIGSHPSLIPCDVSPTHDLWYILNGNSINLTFHCGFRHALLGGGMFMKLGRPKLLLNDTSLLRREYTLLPGLLWRWHVLYGQLPRNDSWIWGKYPDGRYWRQQTEQHGIRALNIAWTDHPRSAKWDELFGPVNQC